MFQAVYGVGVFIGPNKFNVFACEFVQVTRDVAEMGNEFTIISNKSEKFLNFSDVLKRNWPFCDSFHLFWVDSNVAVGYNMSEVFHGCSGEFTLFEFTILLVLVEFLHDLSNVVYMFFFCKGVDENVVEIYNDKNIKPFSE